MNKNGKIKIDLALVDQKLSLYIDGANKAMAEIMAEIVGLRDDFKTMEEGRLTSLEVKYEGLEARFDPVRRVVYGLVGTILLTVLGWILIHAKM